jgi:hypothetical protein
MTTAQPADLIRLRTRQRPSILVTGGCVQGTVGKKGHHYAYVLHPDAVSPGRP